MNFVIFFVSFGFTLSCVTGEFKFTYQMAHRCKEHICQHGYHYETYYRADSNDLIETNKGLNVLFEMHIAIQASSNGHILLSPVANPSHVDDVYELVVGGGGNKFTELRRNLRRNAKISVKTPNILSTVELRAFYIKISEDGIIEFSKEGESMPLLSFYDIEPLQIKYFSFAAWNGVEAKFLYDCPAAGDNATEPATDSQEVEPKLSNSDDLKRTLLMGRLPSIPPNENVTVKLRVKVTNVRYDPFESLLTTWMAVIITWTDDSMAWNPNKFNGTTSIKLRQGQIWRPTFYVYNSIKLEVLETKNADLITMVNSGEATFHFQTKVNTICQAMNSEIARWPRDAYGCPIAIQPWEAHEKIRLEILPATDLKIQAYTDIDNVVKSEWEFYITSAIIEPYIWNLVYETDDNITHQSDRYIIQFDLERRPSVYDHAFYTPLIALTIFVLMSFWSDPLQMSRIWFYSGCTIVMCMGLCYIDYIVPVTGIPTILILYTTVLGGVLLALVVQVILLSSLTNQLCDTVTMKRLILSGFCRTAFCLPTIRSSINGGYMIQEDDDSGVMVPPSDNLEEMESEDKKKYGDKTELAIVVDKIMFIVYSVTIAALLFAHY